jgi:hypothetical protein
MARPLISELDIWGKYKSEIFDVIREALSNLQGVPDLKEDEISLNRELHFCFVEATYRLKLNHHLPMQEGKNPPDPDDEERAKREDKIPDFYWQFSDHTVIDPRRCARRFVLECKRLGKPTSSRWILNKNYVQNGIRRFVFEEHGYGKGDESGAMVGYVQNMEFDVILLEVNAAIETSPEPIPTLPAPAGGWIVNGISRLDHIFERSFLQTPFHLWHLWVDLRHRYDQNV